MSFKLLPLQSLFSLLVTVLVATQLSAAKLPHEPNRQDEPVPAIFINYVLYFDSEDVDAKALFAKHNHGDLKLLKAPEDGVESPGVLLIEKSIEEQPLPALETLPHFSRGFSDEAAQKFIQSKSTISLVGLGPFDPEHKLLKNLTLTVGKMAEDIDAFVFDVADSLTFTKEAFDGIRAAEIREGRLSTNQFGVRAYRVDDGIRSVTMGLEKFGQVNICVPNFAEHHMGVIDTFNSLVVQTVIESDTQIGPGEMALEPMGLTNAEVKQKFTGLLRDGFSSKTVELAKIESVGGDPEDLLAVVFKSKPGEALWQEQDTFLKTIFKETTRVSEGVDVSAVEEAIENARAQAMEILKDKQTWTAAGRRLNVAINLPGKEVVWVEVTSFENGSGKGILKSQPTKNRDLTSGSEIEFEPAMIFDFKLSNAEELISSGGVDALIQQMNSGQ